MIDQFIQMATQKIGAPQQDVEEATSGILSMLKDQADGGDFGQLLSGIGGAEDLMNKFSAGNGLSAANDNPLGGLMGSLGGMLGGSNSNLGALVGAAGLLSQIKLDAGQLNSLTGLFAGFIKENMGDGLAERLMGGLGNLLDA